MEEMNNKNIENNSKEIKSKNKNNRFDRFFKITERGSSVKTEIVGGLVNFLVMCYVVIVIPNMLTVNDSSAMWQALFLSTIIASIFGTAIMALGANMPLVLAPGIGLTTYFASLMQNGYSYESIITIALLSGVVFILITVVGLREKIVYSIPQTIRNAIPTGIGIFIASIGLSSSNSGLLDFLSMGLKSSQETIISATTCVIGLILMFVLYIKKVKGSIFYGIIGATLFNIIIELCVGNNPFSVLNQSWVPPFSEFFEQTFCKFDFTGVFVRDGVSIAVSIISAIFIIFSVFMVDLFDTAGTLYGAAKRANMVDENGKIQHFSRIIWADGLSSLFGAFLGVPACSTYVESTAGIESGARTGFSSVVTMTLFFATIFISPLVQLIPVSATAPALIMVGIIMFCGIVDVDFSSIEEAIPAILTIILMPLTSSISNGIAVGLISYTLIKLFTGKAKQVNVFTYICAVLFLVYFCTNGL